jgi:hypothetical protein
LSIPGLGTLTIRLEDATGGPVQSGVAFWRWANVPPGNRVGINIDSGVLRLERVPLGIPITLTLEFDNAKQGTLEQEFVMREVREETVMLRATGAGTVIFRLHPKGAPDEPLAVGQARVGEHEHHGKFRNDGPFSELRWWTRPGRYRSLRVAAAGFRERCIKDVIGWSATTARPTSISNSSPSDQKGFLRPPAIWQRVVFRRSTDRTTAVALTPSRSHTLSLTKRCP